MGVSNLRGYFNFKMISLLVMFVMFSSVFLVLAFWLNSTVISVRIIGFIIMSLISSIGVIFSYKLSEYINQLIYKMRKNEKY